ncbi:capsular biosynthesis protein [Variovorax sp. Varisp41]|uniref:capsular biosynthesis protein n=1 Tax=Variovorax sp. Varisp41 TaxID=3243033 RepID=UPI0039B4B4AA
MKRLIFDLDHTLCVVERKDYPNARPREDMIERLRSYREQGFAISIYTSRNVNSFGGNVGRINAHTLPIIIDWLARHDVPYDEIHVGKPWCGEEGFYVDDRAIRPSEFLKYSREEIDRLLEQEK